MKSYNNPVKRNRKITCYCSCEINAASRIVLNICVYLSKRN
jgi:hypothetical protein